MRSEQAYNHLRYAEGGGVASVHSIIDRSLIESSHVVSVPPAAANVQPNDGDAGAIC